MNDPKPQNILDSPQWVSQSTATAIPEAAGSISPSGTNGPQPQPKDFTLTASPGILCCGVGEKITVTATATGFNAENEPVSVTTPNGTTPGTGSASREYTIKDTDCGTVLSFFGSGPGEEPKKDAKVPVVKITPLTAVHVPVNRERTLLGVSEDDVLTLTPSIGTCSWVLEGPGKLVPHSHTANFQADDVKSDPTIKVTLETTAAETVVPKSITCSITFHVIPPDGVEMVNFPGHPEFHLKDTPSTGFCARVFVLPSTVCFSNIKIIEDTCTVSADGYWIELNGTRHMRWKDFLPVAEWDETHPSCMGGAGGVDSVIISGSPTWAVQSGHVHAPLPWNYKSISKIGAQEHNFATVENVVVTKDDGKTTISKGGNTVEKEFDKPDEGDPWRCGKPLL